MNVYAEKKKKNGRLRLPERGKKVTRKRRDRLMRYPGSFSFGRWQISAQKRLEDIL
jgi:hypothetical protein